MKKDKVFERLEVLYLLVFILIALIIAPSHIFPPPAFMYVRFPHYLQMMGSFWRFYWPVTFEIYHYVLLILVVITSLNVFGIVFYPGFKKLAVFSSVIGMFLFSLIILFFFLKFINVNSATALIYGFCFVILLIADILTFKALTKK